MPFILLVSLLIIFSSPASAYYLTKIDQGNITTFQGVVLGDNEDKEETKPSEVRKQEDSKPSENKIDEKTKQQNELLKKQAEIKRESAKETGKIQKKIQINNKKMQVFLNPTASTLSVQQQTPENAGKVKELIKKRQELQKELLKKSNESNNKEKELLGEQIKKSLEIENSLKFKTLNKIEDNNLEVESEDNLRLKLDNNNDDSQDKPDIEIEKDSARVKTKLPVGVEATTGNLVVKTDEEELETEHTPDKVLEDLRSKKIIDDFSLDSTDQTESTLVMQDDKPVYEIKGNKKAKFFGLLPVNIGKSIRVSAETGEVVKTSQTGASRLLDFFSF